MSTEQVVKYCNFTPRIAIVVCVSRQLSFTIDNDSISAIGLAMLRWVLATPMGDTRFFTQPVNTSIEEGEDFRNEEDPLASK